MSDSIIVLDLETARSADDCRHCEKPKDDHKPKRAVESQLFCFDGPEYSFEPIGWNNKPALGLSIGGYYDYADGIVHWFDEHSLEPTMAYLVERQPLMVSFNGIGFDFPLMRGILRQRADERANETVNMRLSPLCDAFKALAASSYDILAETWRADPVRKFERGLNSLDAIAQANGLGPKLSHGAQAPRDWQAGKHADVINYCQDDILKTKALFELIHDEGGYLKRGDLEYLSVRCLYDEGWDELPF